jgi:hypothetical protein
MPNIPGQVDRGDSLKLDGKPLIAVTPATPSSHNSAVSGCVDPTEFLPVSACVGAAGHVQLSTAPCTNNNARVWWSTATDDS